MNISIKSRITLHINGTEIEISKTEANKLYEELKQILGKSETDIPWPIFPQDPTWPSVPYQQTEILCNSETTKDYKGNSSTSAKEYPIYEQAK